MTKHWLLFIAAYAFVGAKAADSLADFSNNLFTDLGPLLALFGDSMTKQYLSESTSSWDYVIFAMAPVGIMTAIISVIRVCGHSSLRAFIGRSQEGDGIVEAELCTSTSRDVCELFNRGGITRVLGRPSILELVYIPRQERLETPTSGPNKDKAGLFLSRDFFSNHEEYSGSFASDWEEANNRALGNRGKHAHSTTFSPNPNLSLNIGIVKRPTWVFIFTAAMGIVCQTGVVIMAIFGVLCHNWNLDKGRSALVMFIVGTSSMCLGMWSCARLIGQTTHERKFRRNAQNKSQRSHILWLQPGPQVIGDQSFDPFAHIEKNEKDSLQVWMSSSKKFKKKFELYTFFAVCLVLGGYILQFMGLRGLNAWVSLAQLLIIITMSILRGCLRMQRLGRDHNELAKMPDLVAGYELDWLAFRISEQWAEDTCQHGHAPGDDDTRRVPSSSLSKRTSCEADSIFKIGTGSTGQYGYEDLLQIRMRLANLTGHHVFGDMDDSKHQPWKDEFVKVRVKAKLLSAAICQVASGLFPGYRQDDIVLYIHIATPKGVSAEGYDPVPSQHQIDITLKAPSASSQASWRVDSARIEAILGLWMWTLVSDALFEETHNDLAHTVLRAEKVERATIISAGMQDDNNWNDKAGNMQGEMNLWLGPHAVQFSNETLKFDKQHFNSLDTLWKPVEIGKHEWEILSTKTDKMNSSTRRFCGWNPVHRAASLSSTNVAKIKVQLALVPKTSLLDLCTQELFTALMVSLTEFIPTGSIDKTTIIQRTDVVRLQNKTVSVIEEAFVQRKLGSASDLLLRIIPALREQLPSPDPDEILSVLTKAARGYRQKSEWERAESLLRWGCAHFDSSLENPRQFFTSSLRDMGELYRHALVQQSDDASREIGNGGIEWMMKAYGSAGQRDPEVGEILHSYGEIARKIAQRSAATESVSDDAASVQQQLAKAIADRNRTETLYHLCFIDPKSLRSHGLQPALPLAVRNNWSEVVIALLEMNANLDSRDEEGRSAVLHCAKLGYESHLKYLIDLGASLDLPEMDQMTPLSWASRNGHDRIAELLLKSRHVNANRRDKTGRTPLWWALEGAHESVIKVLVDFGVDIGVMFNHETPLAAAIEKGQNAIVNHLLGAEANFEVYPPGVRTPLVTAAELGRDDLVESLLERGARTDPGDNNGNSPLTLAVNGGHARTVQLLIEWAASINDRDQNNSTPLHLAAKSGYEPIVQMLLEETPDVECQDQDGSTPLMLAAQCGHKAVVQLLLENNADSKCQDKNGFTPLRLAKNSGDESVVQLLLKSGNQYRATPLILAVQQGNMNFTRQLLEKDEPNETDKHGRVPLTFAAQEGHEALTKLLIENGALVDHVDTYGKTPLLVAARRGHENIVRYLIESGADLERKDKHGCTPLALAARREDKTHFGIVRLLVENGANIRCKDGEGRTPLSVARKYRHAKIVRYLEEKEKSKDGPYL